MCTREQVMVRLTQHQLLRVERLGTTLWPQEKLDRGKSLGVSCLNICCGRRISATWWSECVQPKITSPARGPIPSLTDGQ